MTPQTENAIRSIATLDNDITPTALEHALQILNGAVDCDGVRDQVLRRKEVEQILHVHRRTIDYYLDKGYLVRIYGGGQRAVGISRDSVNNFLRRRVYPQPANRKNVRRPDLTQHLSDTVA